MAADLPFPQRFGIAGNKLIDRDFPETARIGLAYFVMSLISKNYLDPDELYEELLRTGRFEKGKLSSNRADNNLFLEAVKSLSWYQVYMFCERAYLLLKSTSYYNNNEGEWCGDTLEQVQEYYQQEINNLLREENLAFHFEQGHFQRKGHAQTQKNIARTGSILRDPLLANVRNHFNKALKYFDALQDVDYENSIKEAVCSLEAMIFILTNAKSGDFGKSIKELQGNHQIPAPIAEVMVKLYAYRGSGQGVAHAAVQGNRVGKAEAELTLSLTAALITYLYDFIPNEEIPF